MAVKVRLARAGAKKNPFYRIVVADSRSPRDGRFIEKLGHYDPTVEPTNILINLERLDYWLQNGATATRTVVSLARKARAQAAT
ncbi:MAG: 30S ribosomal protein S16 [Polyangia bacterium]|jgi:small subunit ribosomal protein S16|nr:30S ribosomal protein S16 [Polyangia bacterium]